MLRLIGSDGCLKIYDEPFVCRNRIRRRIIGREELVICVVESLARICSRLQIRMRCRVIDFENRNFTTGRIRIRFIAGQTIEGMTGGRFICGVIEKPKHLIEGSVFQHQLDDVVYCLKLVRHSASSS